MITQGFKKQLSKHSSEHALIKMFTQSSSFRKGSWASILIRVIYPQQQWGRHLWSCSSHPQIQGWAPSLALRTENFSSGSEDKRQQWGFWSSSWGKPGIINKARKKIAGKGCATPLVVQNYKISRLRAHRTWFNVTAADCGSKSWNPPGFFRTRNCGTLWGSPGTFKITKSNIQLNTPNSPEPYPKKPNIRIVGTLPGVVGTFPPPPAHSSV